jgi:hypothetical protein
MPTRTLVQDLCDVCFVDYNETESEATERLRFGWLGRDYVLLVCDEHVDDIRNELHRLSEMATLDGARGTGGRRSPAPGRTGSTRATGATGAAGAGRVANAAAPATQKPAKTLFSQLGAEEKERFRAWAEMPTARRIADKRIEEWISAGRP